VKASVTEQQLTQSQPAGDTSSTQHTPTKFSVRERLAGICWPGWLSVILLVAAVFTVSGCQAADPFMPAEVYEQVNEDGREWTYDTAWQNIRKLNADLARQDYEDIAEESLFVVSQMERLDRGSASSMSSRGITEIVEKFEAHANERTAEENLNQLRVAGQWLQDSFDNGDFSSATHSAIKFVVIARMVSSD
jgi:hypothetical protein